MAFHSCKNCDHPFGTSYNYCPNCGLKQTDELTVKALFNNTLKNYLTFDARFFKSLKPLFSKPGYLPKAFIKGKRLVYLHPAQFYLFSTIVFFFLFSFQANKQADQLNIGVAKIMADNKKTLSAEEKLEKQKNDSLAKVRLRKTIADKVAFLGYTEPQIDSLLVEESDAKSSNVEMDYNESKVDSLIAIEAEDSVIYKEMGMDKDPSFIQEKWYKQMLKFHKNPKGGLIYKRFVDSIPIALFFLLPFFALLLKLFFSNINYVRHLVFSFYYYAFLFLTFSFVLGINYLYDNSNIIDTLIVLSTFIYLVIAIKKFHNKSWFTSIYKTFLITSLYFILIIPITLTGLVLISFMIY